MLAVQLARLPAARAAATVFRSAACSASVAANSHTAPSLATLLYATDILLAAAALVSITRMRARGGQQPWRLFWVGCGIGLTWELGFFLRGPQFTDQPAYHFIQQFPLHPATVPFIHAVWDGALFMAGTKLVQHLCEPPHFTKFRGCELAVLVAWGNIQEIAIELLATWVGAWTFIPRPYNPRIFSFRIGDITLLPQVIWTIAPLVFYTLARKICAQAR
jgi:hypothetical protein